MYDNCWICSGWREQTFKWKEEHSPGNAGFVYLHADFDGFKGVLMGNSNEKSLKLTRAIPNQFVKYFFTVNDKPEIQANLPERSYIGALNKVIFHLESAGQ